MTRIRKLDINGFKSFADPVSIDFHPGITMLVGPNGCGKTNVVDAIRWVLGERSALRLRGERMENVIFAGTTRRHPQGMAEVIMSVTLEGKAEDESTTTLSRRIFRDGESVYKLNKTTCRLKDVEEYLIDLGIGTGGYLVIEQDMVDMILSERPEERRNLLDEAAGIVRYKRRKDEALRKLESTRINLARVQDVVSEVQGRLETLRKQATRARRARKLAEQIRELEYRIILVHGRELWEKLEKYQLEARRAELEEAEAAALLAEADAKAESARQASDEAARMLGDQREVCHKFQREQDARINREELLGERIEHQRQLAQTTREELEKSQEQLTAYQMELVELAVRLLALENEFVVAQKDRTDKESNLAGQDEELQRKRLQAIQIGEELQTAQVELAETGTKEASAQASLQGALSHLERMTIETGELNSQLREIKKPLVEMKKVTSRQEVDIANSILELEKKLQQLDQIEVRRTETTHQHEDILAKWDFLQNKLGNLEKELSRLASPLSPPQGSLPPPSQWLEVPPDLEIAVAAVIGEILSAPIMPDLTHLTEAYGQLVVKSGWWLWQSQGITQSKPVPKGLPRLLDHLKYPEEYRTLMENLIGDIALIPEVTMGIVMQLGLDWWGVTREGVVIRQDRMGYPSSVRMVPELSLQRELGQTQSDFVVVTQSLAKSKQELELLLAEENKAREEWQKEQGKLELLQSALHQSWEDLQSLSERQKRWEERLKAVGSEMEPQLAIKEKSTLELGGLTEIRACLNERIDKIKGYEALAREAVLENEEQREIAWQYLLESRKVESEIGSRLGNARREQEWLTGQCKSLEMQDKALQEQVRNATEEEKTITKELEKLRLVIKEKSGEQEKLAQMLRETEETLSQARSNTANCDDIDRQRREVHHKLEENAGELKAMLLLAEAEWANLRDKAQSIGCDISSILVKEQGDQIEADLAVLQEESNRAKTGMESMGEVNYLAEEEFQQEEERYKFLTDQIADLGEAERNLLNTINTLDRNSREILLETLERVNTNFQNIFTRLFEGGEAALILPQGQDPITGNLEIIARPPGKRTRHINLLSGGEKALSAIALLFALFLERPSPFCILDEIDAPLDDANVQRFLGLLNDFSANTQFLIITHNKRTMEAADSLVGVTMSEPGVSAVISLKLADVDKLIEVD